MLHDNTPTPDTQQVECIVCKDYVPTSYIHWHAINIVDTPSYQQQALVPVCADCTTQPLTTWQATGVGRNSAAKYLAQRDCERLDYPDGARS